MAIINRQGIKIEKHIQMPISSAHTAHTAHTAHIAHTGHTAQSNEHVQNNSTTIYIYQTLYKVSFTRVTKLNPIYQYMFSMNKLEKTNLLFNKNISQFYYLFKFQCIYIILISYISELIYEFKPNIIIC